MTISPEEIRANNRKKKNKEIWKSKEWKRLRDEFVRGKCCAICGSTTRLTPHHPREESYRSREKYLDLSSCIVLCSGCHTKIHKGYHLCPICKKNLTKYEQCWNCIPDEVKEKFGVKKVLKRKLQRELRKKFNNRYTKVNKNVNVRVPKVD